MYYDMMESQFGPVMAVMDETGLVRVDFQDGQRPCHIQEDWRRDAPRLAPIMRELHEYFTGTRRDFSVAVTLRGTEFQNRVWQELCAIPYGQAISYSELARRIGRPEAIRAVGAANARNPLSIIVPCHRVIGMDGRLTGYAGGLSIKEGLLRLEGVSFSA